MAELSRAEKIRTVIRVSSGNFLEMFDFFVFGYYAKIIGDTYFPSGNAFVSLMLALMTFGAGFIMRPLGAIFLGAYIDQHGRRAGLLLTLSLMAVGIALIAFVPGYATLGALAPILVVLGRLIQGFSAGVELGGVSVYLSEMATPGHKGFYVSWQSGSQQVAVMVVALLGVGLSLALPPETIGAWGWRVPFFVGCLIVPMIFLMRRNLTETEAFAKRGHHATAGEIFRGVAANWPLVIAGMMMTTMTTVSFYFITAYTPTFGTTELHLSSISSLVVTLCVGLSNLIWLPVMGAVSDRVGRMPLLIGFTLLTLGHRLSVAGMARRCAVLRAAAWRRAVAVVSLRQLQRRDGGLSDRDHARIDPHLGLRARLQPRDRDLRRLHPGDQHLSHPRQRQSRDARRVAQLRRALRPRRGAGAETRERAGGSARSIISFANQPDARQSRTKSLSFPASRSDTAQNSMPFSLQCTVL